MVFIFSLLFDHVDGFMTFFDNCLSKLYIFYDWKLELLQYFTMEFAPLNNQTMADVFVANASWIAGWNKLFVFEIGTV